jgi:hypothetical protein
MDFILRYCRDHIPDAINEHGELHLPMQIDVIKEFMGDMCQDRDDGSCKAESTMDHYANSVKWWHKEMKVPIENEIKEFFKNFKEGFKRRIALKKEIGTMSMKEGKKSVTYLQYIKLSKLALFASTNRTPFASCVHSYMILCWNLFARSITVSALRTHHISWHNDSLLIDMSKHKADQTGEKITPKHVYANPYEPSICPILSLALHVFGMSFRVDNLDTATIFPGSPYDVFSKWLPEAVIETGAIGVTASDFGTHSFRKGVTSYCAGFIGGAPITAIFLRAGWSLGEVQQRYISFTEGGDQLAGRMAAGLNLNGGSKFSVLPPHFVNCNLLTMDYWTKIIPQFLSYENGFRDCLEKCLASIVFHYEWITEKDEKNKNKNVAENHPFFTSRLYLSNTIKDLSAFVIGDNISGYSVSGMVPSGIPQYINLSRELDAAKAKILSLETVSMNNHLEVKECFDNLPRVIVEEITKKFTLNGSNVGVSKEDILELVEKYRMERNASEAAASEASRLILEKNVIQKEYTRGVDADGYKFWSWGGKFRPFPESFIFPRVSVKKIFDLFLIGNEVESIRPFRFFKSTDMKSTDKTYFSRARYVVNILLDEGIKLKYGANKNDIYKLPLYDLDEMFKRSFSNVLRKYSKSFRNENENVKRYGDYTYATIYNMLHANVIDVSSDDDAENIDSEMCCCGCNVIASESNHYCSKTNRRVMAWCHDDSIPENLKMFGSIYICKRCVKKSY